MPRILDMPLVLFPLALVAQWAAAFGGDLLRRWVRPIPSVERDDFNTVLAATLTLLGLIIGFSFSMAMSRYDQRKTYEEAEANAIGTSYLRADLLSAADGAELRDLLQKYAAARIAFYEGVPAPQTPALHQAMWRVAVRAAVQPTPITALVVAGVNDVVNAEGYTQSAWGNRIPLAAWTLMAAIALLANLVLGYRAKRTDWLVLFIMPLAVSVALFLIADIDSPTGGLIKVGPRNLEAVAVGMTRP